MPKGHPETGGGGSRRAGRCRPFAVGGAALLTGAGLTGLAARRRSGCRLTCPRPANTGKPAPCSAGAVAVVDGRACC
ncbi:hypothetical protein GCM10020220_062930 [Nonomuraea rubra]|uniref:hypothetical protein n=1 Tax=Nonomuraea rubra TaxID=46180 RepID=UPI0031EA9415